MAKVTLESLAGEIAELRARIESLEGRSAPMTSAPPVGDEVGTTIRHPQRVAIPSDAEARIQFSNVITRNPDAPRLLHYARDGLGLSDLEADLYGDFRICLARIAELQKTGTVDLKRDAVSWTDNTEQWAADSNLGNHTLSPLAFTIAAMSRGCSVALGATMRQTYFNLSL